MRMPLADMLKTVLGDKLLTDGHEVIDILIKKRDLMIGIRTRSDGIKHNWDSVPCPKAEELSAGFDVCPVKNATGNKVQFATVNNRDIGRTNDRSNFSQNNDL